MQMAKRKSGKTEKLLSVLDRLEFFKKITQAEKQKIISQNTSVVQCKKNATIINHGSIGKCIYIILKGSVGVFNIKGEKPLAKLKPGNIFGEVSFLTTQKRTANIIAIEPCILLRLDKSIMEALGIEIREKIKDQIILQLVGRVQYMNKKVKNLSKISELLLGNPPDNDADI